MTNNNTDHNEIMDRTHRLLACDVATRALERERKAGREPDPRSWRAVAVARAFAAGEAAKHELAAASDAAQAAWALWAESATEALWNAKAAGGAWDVGRAAAWTHAKDAAHAAYTAARS